MFELIIIGIVLIGGLILLPVLYEVPKSPWTALMMNRPYWTRKGSSSPSSACRAL